MKLTPIEQKIHDDFSACGQSTREWLRKCALILPKINKLLIWDKKGFESIYVYAAKIAGMNRGQVNEVLRIMTHAEAKPELLKVVAAKGINAVRPIAAISTPETAGFWAKKAMEMSVHTLETYVRDFRASNGLHVEPKNSGKPASKPFQPEKLTSGEILLKIPNRLAIRLIKAKGDRDWEEVVLEYLELREMQLESEKPEVHQSSSHYIPRVIENFVRQRSQNICEYPTCTKAATEIHHTVPFALKKEHNPDRLRNLCKAHHDIAHHGLIENEDLSPDSWHIKEKPDWFDLKNLVNTQVRAHREPG